MSKKQYSKSAINNGSNRDDKSRRTDDRKRPQSSGINSNARRRSKDRVEHNPGGPGGIVEQASVALNDPEWYAASPELLNAAANVSWNTAVGVPFAYMKDGITSGKRYDTNYPSIPGIMAMSATITPGVSKDWTSPVNTASLMNYAFVRHENSGHANYNPPDLMFYLLAVDSAYSFVAWMRRCYGELMIATQWNRYLPKANFMSEGLNYDDFIRHIPDFNFYINSYQFKLQKFAMPVDVAFNKKHMWMFSNLYMDDPTPKAQIYKYVPDGFWFYDEWDATTGGKLGFHTLSGVSTFAQLVAYGEELLDCLYQSEDCGIISGDVLKAYDGKMFQLDALPIDYTVFPVPVPEVLSQIQNTTICGALATRDGGFLEITQDPSLSPDNAGIIFEPYFIHTPSAGKNAYAAERLLTCDNPAPTPSDTIVATRHMVFATRRSPDDINVYIDACGDAVVTGARVYYMDEQGSISSRAMYWTFAGADSQDPRDFNSWLNAMCFVNMFDHHPAQVLFTAESGDKEKLAFIDHDVSNYTLLTSDVVGRMHETALLSEMRVPEMGPLSTLKPSK